MNYTNKKGTISFVFCFCLGLILTSLVIIFAKQIAIYQGVSDSFWGFIAIAPAIFFVALICVYRGVFQGYGNMTPTGISQLIEQIVKLLLGLFLAIILMPFGVHFAVMGALLGITISEVFAFIYLKIKYGDLVFLNSFVEQSEKYNSFEVLKMIINTVLPITLSGIVIPVFLVIESFLCVNLLTFFGQNSIRAISDFGIYSGVVNTIINVPVVILTAIAISAMPIISNNYAKNETAKINANVSKCINLVLFLALPCVLIFCIFPKQILSIIYPVLDNSELYMASKMLSLSASSSLTLGVFYSSTMLLQAMGKFAFPISNVLTISILRTMLYSVLIKFYGIYALPISSAIMYLIMAVLNIVYLRRNVKLISLAPIKILFDSIIFIMLCIILYCFLQLYIGKISIIISFIFSGFVYLILCKNLYNYKTCNN